MPSTARFLKTDEVPKAVNILASWRGAFGRKFLNLRNHGLPYMDAVPHPFENITSFSHTPKTAYALLTILFRGSALFAVCAA